MTASAPASKGPPLRHNLPIEVASFVGRERDIVEIKRLLHSTRLLTLTGAGGCGKTRLALRVAVDLVPSFPDGVWLVPFAPLVDSALVPRAVGAALGVRGTAGRPLLAILAPTCARSRTPTVSSPDGLEFAWQTAPSASWPLGMYSPYRPSAMTFG